MLYTNPISNYFCGFKLSLRDFTEREIIANAVKNMSLHRLYDAGLHKQFILFSCYCLLVCQSLLMDTLYLYH